MTAKIKLNAASGGGSFSLQAPSSSSNNRVMTLPDTADGTILTTTNPKTGNIIQVVTAVTTSTSSYSIASGAISSLCSGLQPSITPSSNSNNVLISLCLSCAASGGAIAVSLFRGSTQIFLADSDGNRQRVSTMQTYENFHQLSNISITFLDTGISTTSATTYGIKLSHTSGSSQTLYVNRDNNNDNTSARVRCASSMVLYEVAA